jgi:integrase
MTNPKKEYRERSILTNEEIDSMLLESDKLKTEYFQLRAKAIICIVKKFGKRRSEIARLELSDLKLLENELEITFHLSKKHKRGLAQFFKVCSKTNPAILEKPLPEIKKLWQTWQQTEQGHTVKNSVSLQSISLTDKYADPIIDYFHFIIHFPKPIRFLFPSGKSIFGETYLLNSEKHLSGSQLLRIIKPLKGDAWLHLFRETKGAEIAKANGRTLNAIYEVRDGLDLENEETAYRYVRRYVAKKQEVE